MENKKTEVDIILPNYNSSEFIEKTIDSVIGQTHKNWNLIIVISMIQLAHSVFRSKQAKY